MHFKEESKEKLSLPRDTLYSRTPVSAWTLMSVNLLPGIIPRFYPECYHTDFHLPKPSCVAGVPRGKQIWVLRAPSKTFWCSVSTSAKIAGWSSKASSIYFFVEIWKRSLYLKSRILESMKTCHPSTKVLVHLSSYFEAKIKIRNTS